MRSRLFLLRFVALAALLLAAACERNSGVSFTAEIDEPEFRRGKELLRQGRNQEALAAFQKVIEHRGENNAPDSHLELGSLYYQHIHDPLAAIYHFRKYRELKPNSPQADLVAGQIEAATREFAVTLPANPIENRVDRLDLNEVMQKLQRENDQLKADLAAARSANAALRARLDAVAVAPGGGAVVDAGRPVYPANGDGSPVVRAAEPETDPAPAPAPASPSGRNPPPANPTPPARPAPANTATATRSANGTTPPAGNTAGRRHAVAKGDTLYSLAQKYYNNRSRWRDIYNANRDVMKSETDLKIGMELKIPQ